MVQWLTYLISTYGKNPAFMRVDGKPVLFVWASATRPLAEWARIITQVRDSGLDAIYIAMGYDVANLEVFSGIHEYNVFSIPDFALTLKTMGRVTHYYPLLAGSPEPRIWVATVQPGYDERRLPGRTGLFQDRENGSFYRRSFQAALESDPDWIVISTWNEWWEQTAIEPSRQYGDEYLRITREFALNWKRERGRN